jgi:hypothetical protein
MSSKVWFGIPGVSMQWAPAPHAGFQKNLQRHIEQIDLESGRRYNVASPQWYTSFQGDFYGDASDLAGIDIYNKYASGFYGSGPLIFADPYAAQSNLFAPHWASPMLSERGWDALTSPLQLVPVSYGALPSQGTWGRPGRYVSYPVVTSVGEAATSANQHNHYLAIPPNQTLYVGVSGDATGSGAVMVQTYDTDNAANTPIRMPLINYADSTQMNMTFPGSSYSAVRIFLSRTSGDDARVALYSMMAQLWDSRLTPDLDAYHQAGQGHLGLQIVGDAIAETYQYNGVKKGLSLTLEESV